MARKIRPTTTVRSSSLRQIAEAGHAGDGCLAIAYASAACFLVAVFAPCFTIYPKFGGEWPEWVVQKLDPQSLDSQSFSLIGGIGHLLHDGDWLIGGVLILFSLIFPAAKLGATFYFLQAEPSQTNRYTAILSNLGKWSMLDVFVVAGIVISFKTFPLGTRIEPRWGIGAFAISVLLSMTATLLLKKHVAADHGPTSHS